MTADRPPDYNYTDQYPGIPEQQAWTAPPEYTMTGAAPPYPPPGSYPPQGEYYPPQGYGAYPPPLGYNPGGTVTFSSGSYPGQHPGVAVNIPNVAQMLMPQLDANCVGCQKMTAVINTGAVYGAHRMRGAGGFPRFYRGGTDQGCYKCMNSTQCRLVHLLVGACFLAGAIISVATLTRGYSYYTNLFLSLCCVGFIFNLITYWGNLRTRRRFKHTCERFKVDDSCIP